MRIVVADDHAAFRRQIREVLDELADVVVVGEAPDGASALRLARELTPDLVIMDLHMPRMDGAAATAEIVKLDEPPRVVVLTASSTSDDVLKAISAGAVGYLLKGAPPDEISTAVRAAVNGGAPLCGEIAGALLEHVRAERVEDVAPEPLPPLTEREAKMLELLALGRDNAAIAEELLVSLATVKSNAAEMYEKLGVNGRVQAAVMAVRAGLV